MLNPTYFEKYEEYKNFLVNKVFLYSEIHPKRSEIIRVKDFEYEISAVFDIEIIGTLTSPKRSLKSILSSCYKCQEFLTTDYDGCLFVYNGFKSSEEELKISDSAVQIKFRVYKLTKL
jgi:hypothetical protein